MKLQQRQCESSQLQNNLSDNESCLLKVDQGQGASSWLTTLPTADKGYDSTKQLFWNLIWIKLVGLSQGFQPIVNAQNSIYSMLYH